MGQPRGVGFPILPVEGLNIDGEIRRLVQTLPRDSKAIGVRAWDIKTFDATMTAEQVSCCVGMKAVAGQCVFAGQETKAGGGDNDMIIAAHRADRAVTDFDIHRFRKIHFKPNSTAVASAGSRCQRRSHWPSQPTQTGGRRWAQGCARSSWAASPNRRSSSPQRPPNIMPMGSWSSVQCSGTDMAAAPI